MAISWIKTGAASAAIAKQDEVEKKLQHEQNDLMWRFFLKDKEDARITFIDGDLSPEGYLVPPRYYEHALWAEGSKGVTYYVCPEKTAPEDGHKCPLCAAGDKPTLVAVFTILDHREIKTKAGKVLKDQKRLFVAKPLSMEMLTKIAVKRGGLAGCTFDVTRMGDKSAAIGSMFDFVEKNDVALLQSSYTEEVEDKGVKKTISLFVPANYEKEIIFRTPEDMLKMGLGAKPLTNSMQPGGSMIKATDYSKNL